MRPSSTVVFALGLLACASSRTSYVGRIATPSASPETILVHRPSSPPSEHEVLGVVTARCDTYDGASGLAESPCHEDELTREARVRAADVGGTLLVDPACRTTVTERTVERTKGGGATLHTRSRLECRYSVARKLTGVATTTAGAKPPAGQSPADAATSTVTVSGVPLTLRVESLRATPAPRELGPDDVGELGRAPANAVLYGRASATCDDECSSSIARRGLKTAAARLGATVLTDVNCEPVAERWSCAGSAYGD
ncbi:MAG: hypothetical protein FJ095_15840 [Deltaproteobacteria bacterium]|nr:hypothetical protein [Deltaproteobacteria bacterium]